MCPFFVLKVIVTYDGPRDGARKDVSGVMPPTYQPLYVEAAWQEWWEASDFYKCDAAKAKVGVLHRHLYLRHRYLKMYFYFV